MEKTQVDNAIDIVILSNGPGELTTWVHPVVRSLRQRLGNDQDQVRISIVLSPCTNASGQETEVASRYAGVDRVQSPQDFFPFLLWGKTASNWDWRSRGVVVFLGGDQFYPVVIGKRLGYRTIVYAEWEARWHGLIDRFGVMKPEIMDRISPKHAHKFTVVGDLMAEASTWVTNQEIQENDQQTTQPITAPLIGLLPGSKSLKLSLGVPLFLAIAEQIQALRPHSRFTIAVAPTLTVEALAKFADPNQNPVINRLGWATAQLVMADYPEDYYLQTPSGLNVVLWTESPAYNLLSQCHLCLTTVGANTAELGALAVPMLVLLPTQQLDVMRAWDGLPGLLANLPGVGSSMATMINWLALRRLGLLAWPNIWANAEIVPELVGKLQPSDVAAKVVEYLDHPEQLQAMRDRLRSVRGPSGAATKLVQLICEELGIP